MRNDRFPGRLIRAVVAAAGVGLAIAAFSTASSLARAQDTGDELDIARMSLSFEDNFDKLDASAWGPGTRWITHTPWSGDFGAARFADPGERTPFATKDGILSIKASRDPEGDWQSGLLASVDPTRNGFSQRYGYFEMRAKLPTGPGLWPAFWLIGKDSSKTTAEIDVIEYYGDKPGGYATTAHVWYRDGGHYSKYNRNEVFRETDPTEFHTYGVKIDPEWIRFYFDRRLVWKTETRPEHRQPMYMLVNLALVDEPSHKLTPDPSFMYVDYIRAYRLD